MENYPFPKEAIREAVLNAIAHKFYGALIPIQISVYEDKIYIANDCIFPSDWTLEEIISDQLDEDYEVIKYQMKTMKKDGLIAREGSSQKGRWVILK